jgi:hypothetical protein
VALRIPVLSTVVVILAQHALRGGGSRCERHVAAGQFVDGKTRQWGRCEWRLVASEQIIKPGYRAGLCRS